MEIVNFRSTKKPFVGTFEEEKKKKNERLGIVQSKPKLSKTKTEIKQRYKETFIL